MGDNRSTENQRVQILAASDSLPTLFNIPSPSALSDMHRKGMVLNVIPLFKELGLTQYLNPATVGTLQKLEGKGSSVLYELPLELNIEGMWYNKALFQKHGIAVPKTWAEMSAAEAKLKAAGVQPFAVSGQQGWPVTRLIGA